MSIQDRMPKVNQVLAATSTHYFHYDKTNQTYGVHIVSDRDWETHLLAPWRY